MYFKYEWVTPWPRRPQGGAVLAAEARDATPG